jgi:hypothetical protein
MFFGLLSMFILARRFWARPNWWGPALLAVCFLLMSTIEKERVPIAGAAVVIILGGVLSNARWRIPILVALGSVAALAVPAYLYLHAGVIAESLGGSLTARQTELDRALAFLNAQPWRWVLGAGAATRIGDVTLGDMVGAPFFFLADLGWLGVIFEYGVIGAALLLVLHLVGLRLTWRAVRADDPLSGAAFDYVLYIVLTSPISSVVLAPGELLTCMAIAWYMIAYRHPVPGGGPAQNTVGPNR